MRRRIGTGYLSWITLFYLIVSLQTGFAQGTKEEQQDFYPLESVPDVGTEPLDGPLHKVLREEIPVIGQALEGVVDPETYRMGPGDLIAVYVLNEAEDQILARIAADGVLHLRNIGVFDTRGMVLAGLKAAVLEAAEGRFRTCEIAVSLAELRNFKASVGGMVWAPGTFNMTAADRVITLLARAGGFYNPARKDQEAELSQLESVLKRQKRTGTEIPDLPSYSARRTQLRHKDGSEEVVDLLLFLRAGRYEGNPLLRDGDFLLVPPLNPNSGVLGVYGAVNDQGLIEYLDGDDLQKALMLAGGLTLDALRNSIEVTRFIGEGQTYHTFYVNLGDPGASEIPLYPDDRIYVRSIPNYHERHQVELRGEFSKPGFYPVSDEGTPLVEIIMKAGGFTAKASLKEALLTRLIGIELVDPEYERLRQMPVADMKPLEFQYFKTKAREVTGQVVVDLYALFSEGDSTHNVLLRNSDILEVPPITRAVKVTGQVEKPGIVTYKTGEPYDYYIDKSGGFSWNARKSKIRIIKSVTGKWVKPRSTIIEEGDTIFIPEKAEINYWEVYKDVMLVVTQFATLYLIYITANN
ncbi:SLBB domain-containing protein [bacterium]|nr:SLBB domain-containing protein [bacterium]